MRKEKNYIKYLYLFLAINSLVTTITAFLHGESSMRIIISALTCVMFLFCCILYSRSDKIDKDEAVVSEISSELRGRLIDLKYNEGMNKAVKKLRKETRMSLSKAKKYVEML